MLSNLSAGAFNTQGIFSRVIHGGIIYKPLFYIYSSINSIYGGIKPVASHYYFMLFNMCILYLYDEHENKNVIKKKISCRGFDWN